MYVLGLMTLAISALTAWMVTPLVIRAAPALGALDHPGPRKIHTAPIPRIGGVAVFAGFLAGMAFAGVVTGALVSFPKVTVYWSSLAAAAACLFLLGLLDDIRGVGFQWKFAVQIVASVAVWLGGFRVETLSFPLRPEILDLGVWSLPLTVLWIVGVTNALNLIDGLDGLAAGIALITTGAVAVIAFVRDQTGVLAAGIALVGSLLGFLRFNFSPARIFLGDSGSMFLGFVLAVVSIRGSQKGTTAVAVLAPMLVLGLPILDTALAILRRTWRIALQGASEQRSLAWIVRNSHMVFLPDRGHLHHRLLEVGLSQRRAVLVLYGIGLLLAIAALADVVMDSVWVALVLVGALAVLIFAFLAGHEILARRHRARRASGGGTGSCVPTRDGAESARP